MNRAWWKEAVVYQIYPISFKDSNGDGIGDLKGITSKLDYLQNLGVNVIWLCPIYKSPMDDNGYDISDYKNINPMFGTMEDFEQLVKEANKREIKILMDLVVNHTSSEHSWFMESKKSKDNPYRDYYIWKDGIDGKEPNNWVSVFSGSAWEYDEKTQQYYLHVFAKSQPDLNWENEKVRENVYDTMKFWLDKGIGGFRMDVINFISKEQSFPSVDTPSSDYVWGGEYFQDGPKIHQYLNEMNKKVLSQYDCMTVGEMPGVTVEEAKLYTCKDREEVNMCFQFELMDIDSGNEGKWDLRPFDLRKFKEVQSKWQYGLDQGNGWNSIYLNNHDQPRVVSRFGNDKEYRKESAKMLATMSLSLQGTPYIYQGEEIGMTNVKFDSIENYKDIEIINYYNEQVNMKKQPEKQVMNSIYAKGRDNARTPMQWDNSENSGFTSGKPWIKLNPNYKFVNTKEALEDKKSVFNYYKNMIKIRKENKVLVYGKYDEILEEHNQIYAYTRTLQDEKWIVLLNFSEYYADAEIQNMVIEKVVISNYENPCIDLANLRMRPYEAVVYKIK